jgi:hypothetical protein
VYSDHTTVAQPRRKFRAISGFDRGVDDASIVLRYYAVQVECCLTFRHKVSVQY